MGKCQGDSGIPQPSLQSEDMPQKPLDISTSLFYPRAEEQQASLPGEQPYDADAARIHKSVRVCSHMVHQKAPCCKAGRFSYADLYWENRHLVSGLPFLVYTSEYSISGLRMCLQNGGSAVSWKSELKSAKLDGVLQAAEKGKLWQPGKYNEPAPEIVWYAQLPAPVMVVVIKRWSVKNGK